MANCATDVLKAAVGEIGYDRFKDPELGTRYGRWYAKVTGSPYFGQNGVPYCAMFASWCFAQAGAKCAGLPGASTTAIYNAAKAAGALVPNVRDAQPGDVLLMDWLDGDGFDHTCLCEKNCDSYVQTIEGNVGGGKVQRRTRDWKYVRAVVRPSWGAAAAKQAATTAKQATTQPPRANLLVDGQMGPLTVRALQHFLNVTRGAKLLEDGQLGPLTVKAWQTYLRDVAKSYSGYIDGDLGPMTAKAIQLRERSLGYYWYVTKSGSHANCSVDGQFGSYTVRAVQRALNDGKL